ncbi:hypothetical protein RirG_077200 [Rhizophagus irregularis DAOM 197198w]|uniref:Uncharacterized protein n=1 Tax=Rhizophagus irregularis (strain DAOM 197198w) TaxID=1432141 RepID=A0A015LG74_RHIIW|nr:hypothetical protein RirG_077200 [Rhizophagus irregularis DAOM 197198w]
MDDREIPSGTTTPRYIPERTEQNQGRPIGPKGMKWSNKRQVYYDPTEGLRKWREAGGPTKPREYGPRLTDGIPPYDIVGDVKNCRANITIGQLTNENPKYHKQLREGTYRPRKVEVIDSEEEDLILGNDIWKLYNAKINFEDHTLRIEEQGEIITIPVGYEREVIYESEESEDDEEYESNDEGEVFKMHQNFK